jgi:hypothetical protein
LRLVDEFVLGHGHGSFVFSPITRSQHWTWVCWVLIALGALSFQFLLGHVSIQTTEHYLGCKQKLRFAVNDKIAEP